MVVLRRASRASRIGVQSATRRRWSGWPSGYGRELERQRVSALKVPVDEFVSVLGSLERLRKAGRLAGARYGWTKTGTTKVVDDAGVEWLVLYEYGPRFRLVGEIDPKLQLAMMNLDLGEKHD